VEVGSREEHTYIVYSWCPYTYKIFYDFFSFERFISTQVTLSIDGNDELEYPLPPIPKDNEAIDPPGMFPVRAHVHVSNGLDPLSAFTEVVEGMYAHCCRSFESFV
jgi:hypothetical protein